MGCPKGLGWDLRCRGGLGVCWILSLGLSLGDWLGAIAGEERAGSIDGPSAFHPNPDPNAPAQKGHPRGGADDRLRAGWGQTVRKMVRRPEHCNGSARTFLGPSCLPSILWCALEQRVHGRVEDTVAFQLGTEHQRAIPSPLQEKWNGVSFDSTRANQFHTSAHYNLM
mmetsp:Transcript_147987/g.258617  ORF Transcript_147987/g.258617 Transcript_147987/m.258617 type:complete len:168 (-) Transcript_147987:322-825(-)